jgi:adenine-specific DNA-methyltransferase
VILNPLRVLNISGELKGQNVKAVRGKDEYQLVLMEEGTSEPIPSTRYQGSKAKLVNWIWECTKDLEFDNVVDIFGGTGVVGYMYKRKGKTIYYNDYLTSNYLIGLSLIENNNTRLTNGDIQRLLEPDPSWDYKHFISETFKDIYYTDEENQWLDMVIQNISRLENPCKRALSYNALFQACLVKRPFNLFHRKNLYLRLAKVPRTFGNKATWDKPFPEHFYNFIFEVNGLVFDNGRENKALNLDVCKVEGNFDLVYIDPPYTNQTGISVDYLQFYHFLEGLAKYDTWALHIDYKFKHRCFKRYNNPWNDPKRIRQSFRDLFERFKGSILVVSYREDGIPAIIEIVEYLESLGKKVNVETLDYKYVLSNSRSAEVLVIGV